MEFVGARRLSKTVCVISKLCLPWFSTDVLGLGGGKGGSDFFESFERLCICYLLIGVAYQSS